MGESFADHLVEGVLGQGGMGTVYRARHPRLPRLVALKLLHRAVSQDEELRRRFIQEANVVARLEHPGIVGIYDRGTTDGHLWISMQYIAGIDAARLATGTTPPAHILRIITDTADALDYAHSRGVLHRDIKPANILLSEQDSGRGPRAVLTDFGIARLLDSDTKLTATGTFTATLAYASPEQLSGDPIDHRADQYSLACTLYALLAGRAPFAATNPGQVVAGHIAKPVPRISHHRPDLPAPLDDVISRAMAKQRQDRFDSCAEFAAAATAALHGRPSSRTAPTVLNSRTAPTRREHDQWNRPSPTLFDSQPTPTWETGGSVYPAPMSPVGDPPQPSGRTAGIAAIGTLILAVLTSVPVIFGILDLLTGRVKGRSYDATGETVVVALIFGAITLLFAGGAVALLSRRRFGRFVVIFGTALAALAAAGMIVQNLTDGGVLAVAVPTLLLAVTVLGSAISPSTGRWLAYRPTITDH
ncbi:serine/threonine-protein kinase [Nocardia tenerifensis]|uniref:serine/threonine-protein kinase n=1 Tax=Nocardia tenerifensis TaxID=228006 RepID=UPI000688E6E6|nr:serine/threonine-protein kinase [Nocardia tenerifensis]